MGEFYFSVHVKDTSQEAVISVLDETMRLLHLLRVDNASRAGVSAFDFFVSPPISGWVSIYGSDFDMMTALGMPLSERLSTYSLFLMLYDSDVWFYTFYHQGRYVDAFSSWPEYFDATPEPICMKNAELLKPVLARDANTTSIFSILKSSRAHNRADEICPEDLLLRFAHLLGIRHPDLGYTHIVEISHGGLEEFDKTVPEWREFMQVGYSGNSSAGEVLKRMYNVP